MFIRSFVSGAVCLLASPALSVTIDFETDQFGNPSSVPRLFADADPLTTGYTGLGVTFAGAGAVLNQSGNFGVTAFSGDNFLAYNTVARFKSGARVGSMDTMTFSAAMSQVSFNVGHRRGGSFTAFAKNASGSIVDTISFNLTNALQRAAFSGFDIHSIDYTFSGNVMVLDDLNFSPSRVTPIPAPLPGLLLTTAILGLVWRNKAAH